MKKILVSILCLASLFVMISCSDGADPAFRIKNDRADKANVQIQTSGGHTININDVVTGVVSEFQRVDEGNIIVTAVIQNELVSPTVTFFAANDKRYTIIILAGNPPLLRADED